MARVTAHRVCSECPNSLAGKGPHAKTCSEACRGRRSRRLKRQKADAARAGALPDHQKHISDIVRERAPDAAKQMIQEELRPVVREALNEDVMRAIEKMVSLTPRVVDAIEEDLHSEDATVRQRAYSLVAKYTIGHPALVKDDEETGKQLVVNFQLPRPETPGGGAPLIEADADELRQCDSCRRDKPYPAEFVANSTRCLDCFEKAQAQAQELLGT